MSDGFDSRDVLGDDAPFIVEFSQEEGMEMILTIKAATFL